MKLRLRYSQTYSSQSRANVCLRHGRAEVYAGFMPFARALARDYSARVRRARVGGRVARGVMLWCVSHNTIETSLSLYLIHDVENSAATASGGDNRDGMRDAHRRGARGFLARARGGRERYLSHRELRRAR